MSTSTATLRRTWRVGGDEAALVVAVTSRRAAASAAISSALAFKRVSDVDGGAHRYYLHARAGAWFCVASLQVLCR